jgi:hypothetical protein
MFLHIPNHPNLIKPQTSTRCVLFHRIDEKVTLFSRLIGFLVNEALPTHFTYALIRLKQHPAYVPTKQSENGLHSKWETEREHTRSEAPNVDHTLITNAAFDTAQTGSGSHAASEHANESSKGGANAHRGSVVSSNTAQKDSRGGGGGGAARNLHVMVDGVEHGRGRGQSTSPNRSTTPRVRMPKFVWAKHVLEKGLPPDTHGQVCACSCLCICGTAA